MERLVGYMAAILASLIGWRLGAPLGPLAGFVLALVMAGVGMYAARRWWRHNL